MTSMKISSHGDNMQRGVVLFAYNSETVDYFSMAQATARRVNQYLDLPVTLITNPETLAEQQHNFDQVIFLDANDTNRRKRTNWINKGRYQAYKLSPYDDTLVLDTDYMINSPRLLKLFDVDTDFLCHDRTFWLTADQPAEKLNPNTDMGIRTLWATVMRFRRTTRTQQIFGMMEMVQDNYEHYSEIYGFLPYTFRNDYALTIAHKTVNGHLPVPEDFIPWPLVHVGNEVTVQRETDTAYTLTYNGAAGKPSYITVSDLDFHMLGKQNFLELVK